MPISHASQPRLYGYLRSSPLVGRHGELTAVSELLTYPSVRLVTLTGRSGVGKTRLALEVAWALDAARPGSVYVVSLASVRSPELVVAEIAAQLDIAVLPDMAPDTAVARWLSRSPILLVLDNFEHLLGAVTLLGDLLDACDELKLLVTSQAPLRLREERVVRLAPLPLPDDSSADLATIAAQPAVALYCDRARAVSDRFQFDDPAAADIVALCRELEGLPLAIELAAARAVMMPAREILTRLPGYRLNVLRAPMADAPARHHDMRAAIAWTFSLLPAFEQDLLRRLSVTGGAFEIEDAEALTDKSLADVLDALSGLVDVHLVEPVPGGDVHRFELPPSIRDFGREELAASGQARAVEERWLAWIASRARQASRGLTSPGADAWWTWLEEAHDCLRNALQTSLDSERAVHALDLASGLAPYWNSSVSCRAYTRLLDRAIELAEAQNLRSGALAEALLWSGIIGIRVLAKEGRAGYLDRLERGDDLARSLGNEYLILLALHCRVLTSPMTGQLEFAAEWAREGLALANRLAAPCWIARFEVHVARCVHRGRGEQAVAHCLNGLATARAASDTRAILNIAVLLHTVAAEFPAAAAELPPPHELLEMARANRQTMIEAVLLPIFSVRAVADGDIAVAAGWCARGLELAGDDPSSILTGWALFAAVEIAARRRDFHIAARLHGRLRQVEQPLYATMSQPYVATHMAAIEGIRQALGSSAFDAEVGAGGSQDWKRTVVDVADYLRALDPRATSGSGLVPDTRRTNGRSTLTGRQLTVVRLLADGLTNKEIARQLSLTPKTVMHHTVAIYGKLGVRGRTEAVAWAIRSGLTAQ